MSTNKKLKVEDNIPIDIQLDIIKRLPIKSLIRCTVLSKLLNESIKSSSFVTDHSVHHNQHQHLLLRYETNMYDEFQQNYVPIADNDNFPQNKLPITVPETVNRIDPALSSVVSSSHGLLCLLQSDKNGEKCFIWNPSIQKCIVIPILDALHWVLGFGVCPGSSDPKLVKIRAYGSSATSNSVNWEAEVYTVSSGVWRTVPSDKDRKSVSLTSEQVVINGIIYFRAWDNSRRTRNGRHRGMIITFDLTSEKIGEVKLPDNLANSYLSTRMGSLALIKDYNKGEQRVCDVWIMKTGVPKSCEKLFTFKAPMDSSDRVLGFRKNGEPILLRSEPSNGERFEVYRPCSKQFTDLEVFGNGHSMMVVTVDSLTQTLLLIDQPNTILTYDDSDDDGDVFVLEDDIDEDDNDEDDNDEDENDDDDDNVDHDADDDGNDDHDDDAITDAAVLIDMFQVN